MITVLHITPHLGGGVGKALSGLVVQSMQSASTVHHVVACLEKPEKYQFVDRIRDGGGDVIIGPDQSYLDELISTADIVQLEWWNHPATIECLCHLAPQPIRLLVWCHVSGLYNPIIPPRLMEASHRFLFTSSCSFEAKEVAGIAEGLGSKLGLVSSGGGFEGLPEPTDNEYASLSVGYFGSLNFAKLHPNYIDFLSAVNLPSFKVRLIGDLLNRETLEKQCIDAGRAGMLNFRGYTTDVVSELSEINVLAYLLNPRHYGTAENALIETMAMGIVPIVLNNAAERSIVEHLYTGLVIHSRTEFCEAVKWLEENPRKRRNIGRQAAQFVREQFTREKIGNSFAGHYADILIDDKRVVSFLNIFGTTPDQWFLSCQGDPSRFATDGTVGLSLNPISSYELLEKTKGSVFHFHHYFPENTIMAAWVAYLDNLPKIDTNRSIRE